MEPEDEFIENASTLMRFAKEELKQFITWTNPQTSYGKQAGLLVQQLEAISLQMEALRQDYKKQVRKN
ncbi:hypothetical protein GCM10011375_35860 [Hymenobacter qilianensis]|uniref:Uncharacterized protein n=2 Tax=Hymenobacter qilianensis TaxID=1385715 RepID=A0ACB5PW00_9BACT|nr:hypothetical protein [Hymenobacter qilianensis]QNP51190.1 hypothetical protein H9L05_13945 [Hymenobacter qilianensis]GGF77592.1 hypothetical protein GCM10011375_35860 [Hymenobacter qilianensis]